VKVVGACAFRASANTHTETTVNIISDYPLFCLGVKSGLSYYGKNKICWFENRVLSAIFELTGEEDCRKLHNMELHDFYSSPINRNIKSIKR
jgi:hypothetical protein